MWGNFCAVALESSDSPAVGLSTTSHHDREPGHCWVESFWRKFLFSQKTTSIYNLALMQSLELLKSSGPENLQMPQAPHGRCQSTRWCLLALMTVENLSQAFYTRRNLLCMTLLPLVTLIRKPFSAALVPRCFEGSCTQHTLWHS